MREKEEGDAEDQHREKNREGKRKKKKRLRGRKAIVKWSHRAY